MFKRVVIIILDACGVGELPDAAAYGDRGAATLPNVARARGGLNMPHCRQLGLGNITAIEGVPPVDRPQAAFGKMIEKSPGKDSTTGHWEIAGLILEQPFPTYPDGFPPEVVAAFEQQTGLKTIGNVHASGTEIIRQLGERHLRTGEIILYTSADSVFQLAAHEDVIPLERLYEICRRARRILTGEHAVGRVIARPFIGSPGNFTRTAYRRDFSVEPRSDTLLDALTDQDIPVTAIGKINDIFAHRGISRSVKTLDNEQVVDNVIDRMKAVSYGLIFANLVDFDMLWGHRNDTDSFARGLEAFDRRLPEIVNLMATDDLLIITADHGCDPTLKHSTDHTREYVPVLAYTPGIACGPNLGTRATFADVASTVAENYKLSYTFPGKQFLDEIINCRTVRS